MSWKDKQAEAKALIAEAKEASSSGKIDSAETAETFAQKVKAAQGLMLEVKSERQAEEMDKLAALLEQAEGQSTDVRTAPVGMGAQKETAEAKSPYGAGYSVKNNIQVSANFRDHRLQRSFASDMELKVLGDGGTGAAGGFLVPPTYLQDLFAETRRQGNALRRYGMMSEHPVESNVVLLPRGAGSASVGIVAESATKPSTDQSYSQITVNIFTWAGISKVSKQLVQDSNPTAADLVTRELGTLLGNLEEQKIINGSGTGEPRGILQTTGITAVTSSAGATGQAIIDSILDAVVGIQTSYFAPPTGLLMHPRRWGYLAKAKDTATNYLFNNPGVFRAPGNWPDGVTSQSTGGSQSMPSLLGLPIAISANIPTNLGVGTNQDVIIVGDWTQAHWFQRQDITMDVSDEAGTSFETNQVWYRMEERAGFTAERYPSAFATIGGTNLALV